MKLSKMEYTSTYVASSHHRLWRAEILLQVLSAFNLISDANLATSDFYLLLWRAASCWLFTPGEITL